MIFFLLKSIIYKIILELRYASSHLKIGFLSIIKNTQFAYNNRVGSKSYLETVHLGKNSRIENSVYLTKTKIGMNVSIYDSSVLTDVDIGDYSYVSSYCHIVNTKIGKFCSIAPFCKIGLGVHPSRDFVSTHPAFYSTSHQIPISFVSKNLLNESVPIIIGNDVWIGTNVIIRDGVTIGDGAIVGAGAVVVKDIPPYAVVVGVPAKVKRFRFSPAEIRTLDKLQWWNKNEKWLRENADKFRHIKNFTHK